MLKRSPVLTQTCVIIIYTKVQISTRNGLTYGGGACHPRKVRFALLTACGAKYSVQRAVNFALLAVRERPRYLKITLTKTCPPGTYWFDV